MSLIDEALKRARQEAAQQDAARRAPASAPSWAPLPLAPLRERRGPLPAFLAGALAIALLAGGAYWLSRRSAAETPAGHGAPVAASAAAPAPPGVEHLPALPPGERRELLAALPTASDTPRIERSPARAREPVTTVATSRPARAPATTARREAPVPEAAAVPLADTPAPEDGKSYVREAQLPGGRKLQLRGIAFSDTQPVVLINGKVLSPGEAVEGYTVVGIQQDRVELKGASGTLYLTLQ